MTEELFHAYQDMYYPNGTSQYLSVGRINMEFEAKLFRDVMFVNTPPTVNLPSCCGTVNNAEEANYAFWLADITDQYHKYPANNAGIFASKYSFYMNEFDSSWPVYPGTQISGMNPDAFFSLINNSGCPKIFF